jgi:hypothetical protein
VEGWVTDEGLPKGWRIRSKDRLKDNWQFYFLSPQMETFKSNKAVLDYIRYQCSQSRITDPDFLPSRISDPTRTKREIIFFLPFL